MENNIKNNLKNNWKQLIVAIIVPLVVGGISGFITMNSMDQFEKFKQPALSPPSWLFPVVWTILFVLMGIASYLVYTSGANDDDIKNALILYGVQLLVNFFWPILFFTFDAFLFSFIWILVLWILIIATIVKFNNISKVASYLLIPYLLWVTFAAYLNLSIYFLNR